MEEVPGLSTRGAERRACGVLPPPLLAIVRVTPEIKELWGSGAVQLDISMKSFHVFICALGYFSGDG